MYSIFYFVFIFILAYLIAKFVLYAKIEAQERKAKELNKTSPVDENLPAFKQALKIIQISDFISSYLKTELKLKSELIYLEIVIFFYFINNVSLSIVAAPISTTVRVLPMLQDILKHDNKSKYTENKDIVDILIKYRFKMYFDIMYKYSEKLTVYFLQDAYRYIAELILYTEVYEVFMDSKQKPLSLQDWEEKSNTIDLLKQITKIFNKNNALIFKFASSKAFDKNKIHKIKS